MILKNNEMFFDVNKISVNMHAVATSLTEYTLNFFKYRLWPHVKTKPRD